MAPLRIGSLFTGTGALDLAVMDVFDAEVVWHSQYEPPDKNGKEDKNQYAAKILARHWPAVPNLGDITKVDWEAVLAEHGPIDVVTGGFPCTDVSSAGKRAGLTPDTRSGLWNHMARCIAVLRPRLVVIENVEGLLSAEADRGLESGVEAVDEDAGAGGLLRALGAVLGDLATLGFHAEWARVAASEVGAPHPRKRVFVYAWPADVDPGGIRRRDGQGVVGGLGAEERDAEAPADTEGVRHGPGRLPVGKGSPVADAGVRSANASDAPGAGLQGSGVRGRLAVHGGSPLADPCSVESERRGIAGVLGSQTATQPGKGDQRERAGHTAGDRGEVAADSAGERRGEGRPEPARFEGGSDAPKCGSAAPADADHLGRRADVLQLRPGQPDLDWGDYEPAIRRWEHVLGRPAPWPTDALGRLSAVFTEWMMGLPDGWVTCTPNLTRSAMLKALGNGVVRLQAAAALVLLHRRATAQGEQTLPERQVAA
jgi:DNA (cytosine-5)-methyltransferase 1